MTAPSPAAAPLALSGHGVRLEPLVHAHADGLRAATADGALWTLTYTSAPEADEASVAGYIDAALAGQATGTMRPFAVLLGDRVVGTTRYYDIARDVPNCAIGYTWYAASVQRTHVNTACKRLLLGHAFDTLGMQAVYFHTSHQNLRSRAAIERLGAKLDGVIRRHKRQRDGSLRDTYSYSIIAEEWPAVRDTVDERLQRG